MEYREEGGGSFVWFLAGLGVGAAVALLYAPRRGSEIRGFISEKAGEAGGYVGRHGKQVYEKGRELVDQATTKVGELTGRGAEAAQEGGRMGPRLEQPTGGPKYAQG